MKKTAILVAIAIIAIIWSRYSEAENGARIGIGRTVINSELKVGEIGYEYNSWEVNAALIEAGDTKNGPQDQAAVYSVSHITRPAFGKPWAQPFMRLGVSYNTGSELVGRTNFRLGVGLDFSDIWRVEYSHLSSAGIHQTNTGTDYVSITYKAPLPW